MGAADFGGAAFAIDSGQNLLSTPGKTDALRVQPDVDSFLLQDFFDAGRNIFVFTLDQPGAHLEDGDLASEAPEHLTELEADVAASGDDQAARQEIDVHHRTVGEVRNLIDSG